MSAVEIMGSSTSRYIYETYNTSSLKSEDCDEGIYFDMKDWKNLYLVRQGVEEKLDPHTDTSMVLSRCHSPLKPLQLLSVVDLGMLYANTLQIYFPRQTFEMLWGHNMQAVLLAEIRKTSIKRYREIYPEKYIPFYYYENTICSLKIWKTEYEGHIITDHRRFYYSELFKQMLQIKPKKSIARNRVKVLQVVNINIYGNEALASVSHAKATNATLNESNVSLGPGSRMADPTAGVVVSNPKHPDYLTLESRTSSYRAWPAYLDQTPRQMAEAGFFFVGVSDFTRCFACGCGLRNWEPGDDPVLEHTRWFPRCEYINKLKGERYVQAVERRHREHMAERQRQQNEIAQRRAAMQTATDPLSTSAAVVLGEMGYTVEKIREAVNAVRLQTVVCPILHQPHVSNHTLARWTSSTQRTIADDLPAPALLVGMRQASPTSTEYNSGEFHSTCHLTMPVIMQHLGVRMRMPSSEDA